MKRKTLLIGILTLLMVNVAFAFNVNDTVINYLPNSASIDSYIYDGVKGAGNNTNFSLSFDGSDDYIEITIPSVSSCQGYYYNSTDWELTSTPFYISGSIVQIGKSGASTFWSGNLRNMSCYDGSSILLYFLAGDQLTDLSSNGNNAYGFNGVIATNDRSFRTDGINDFIDTFYAPTYTTSDSFSVSYWFKTTKSTRQDPFGALRESGSNDDLFINYINVVSGKIGFQMADGSGFSISQSGTTTVTDGNWHFVSFVRNRNTDRVLMYVDGSVEVNVSDPFIQDIDFTGTPFFYGNTNIRGLEGSTPFQGELTNIILTNNSLNPGNVSELYSNGRTYEYFPREVQPTVLEYPYEEMILIQQDVNVSVTSTSFEEILSFEINKTEPITSYMSVFGNVEAVSNPVPNIDCCLNINGNCINSNITYSSPTLNNKYSFYATSDTFNYTAGTNTGSFRCKGSSTKEFIISNTVITGFEFMDTKDYNFTHINRVANYSVNSVNYVSLVNLTLPVPVYNFTNSNKSKYIVYDIQLAIDYPVTNTGYAYLEIDGFSCAESKRYGVSGQTGTGNFICAKKLDDNQTTVNVTAYGKGIYDVDIRGIVKYLVLEDYEFNLSIVNNVTFNQTEGWKDIYSTNLTIDYIEKGIFGSASVSSESNTGNLEAEYRFKLTSENGSVLYRDYQNTGESGLLAQNYVFTNLSVGNYTITYQAKANGLATDQGLISSANFLTYVEGVSDISPNTFAITGLDNVFSTNVQNFTVRDGLTISTTNGIINYPKQNELINLTFTSEDYYNQTVLNHNTSNDLEFSVTPYPYLNVTAHEFFTNDQILNFTIQDVFGNNYTTTNGINLFQIDQDLYSFDVRNQTLNFTFISDNHLSRDFQVLINESINFVNLTEYRLSSFWVYFIDEETSEPVSNVEFELRSDVYSGTFNSSTNNSYFFEDIPNAEYEIRYSLNTDDYLPRSYFLMIPISNINDTNLTLRVINSSNGINFVREVVDNDAFPLSGDLLEVQRFYPDINEAGEWLTVERSLISSEGDALFSAIPNTISYRFRILRNYNIIDVREPTYLTQEIQEIRVDDAGDILDTIDAALGISVTNITYQRNQSVFFWDYTSTTSDFDEVCLSYNYRYKFQNNISTVCSSELSATLILPVQNIENGTYIVTGFMVRGEETINLRVQEFEAKEKETSEVWDIVSTGLLYFVFIILCLGIMLEGGIAPGLLLALGGTGVLGVKVLFIIPIPGVALGGIIVSIGILLYIVQKGQ